MGGDFFYPVQRRYRISVAAQLRNTALGFHLYDSVLVETYTIWRQGFHVNSFLFFFYAVSERVQSGLRSLVAARKLGSVRPALGVRGSVRRRHDIQVLVVRLRFTQFLF